MLYIRVFIAIILMAPFNLMANVVHEVDICVYGGTSAGVIAAYTAKQSGKSVVLIEPGHRLGGLSSGGLGQTDIGNKYAITGLSRDFYRRIGQHYGKFEQWIFEPKVAEEVFLDYIRRGKVDVIYDSRLFSVKKENGYIREITLENALHPDDAPHAIVRAKMFIDCTYEGDLMAQAGVSYAVGREDNKDYNETYNGVQLRNQHQFPNGVDPYKTPGKPESGLIWGISANPLEPAGTGDKKVQAYNYRICLTSDKANQIPITRPENYDSTRYELLIRLMKAQPGKTSIRNYFIWSAMPGNKTDINNNGGFSTDMIGANYAYPEGTYAERAKIIREHEAYTKGLLYFVGHDPRVPATMREEMAQWGYPADEYTDNGHWTPQLYVREARRMISSYVMTQANCEGVEVVDDGIGMAAYTMDSHNCQRIVLDGQVKNEGDVQIGTTGPYPIAYRSIVPKQAECRNLLVPVCLSASHIAFGSIRMEPVFMVLGQSSATAAVMAIDAKTDIQQIDVQQLRKKLTDHPLVDNRIFEILVDNDDREHVAIIGDWETSRWPCYGQDMLRSKGDGSVKYIPEIPRKGQYDIYLYLSKSEGLASEIPVSVFDGKDTVEHIVKPAEMIVQGQTSGEWISLGKYHLPKGKKGNITVHAKQASGIIPADAIILVPSAAMPF